MQGPYLINLKVGDIIEYNLILNRKVTIINDNSGTGKTKFIDLIQTDIPEIELKITNNIEMNKIVNNFEYERYIKGKMETIEKKNGDITFKFIGKFEEGEIIVIDDTVFKDKKIFKGIKKIIESTDNFFIIVTRNRLVNINHSVEEICSYHYDKGINKLFQKYRERQTLAKTLHESDLVVVEDAKSGMDFIKDTILNNLLKENTSIISAKGKDNIVNTLKEVNKFENIQKIAIIADGSAFGDNILDLLKQYRGKVYTVIALPESMEFLFLHHKYIINNSERVRKFLDDPLADIDNKKFISLEKYATHLLSIVTNNELSNKKLRYNKGILNNGYKDPEFVYEVANIPLTTIDNREETYKHLENYEYYIENFSRRYILAEDEYDEEYLNDEDEYTKDDEEHNDNQSHSGLEWKS